MSDTPFIPCLTFNINPRDYDPWSTSSLGLVLSIMFKFAFKGRQSRDDDHKMFGKTISLDFYFSKLTTKKTCPQRYIIREMILIFQKQIFLFCVAIFHHRRHMESQLICYCRACSDYKDFGFVTSCELVLIDGVIFFVTGQFD